MCGINFNGIGRWNGANWDVFGIGINQNDGGAISTYATYNNHLYVGGFFIPLEERSLIKLHAGTEAGGIV